MQQSLQFEPNIIEKDGKKQIFDVIPKKFVAFTAEEFVRQYFIDFMIRTLNYSAGLMAVEKSVVINGMRQRADILLYNRKGKPVMIVECKAPNIEIGQATIEQAARYNLSLGVKYLVITNCLTSYCVKLDYLEQKHELMSKFPTSEDVGNS